MAEPDRQEPRRAEKRKDPAGGPTRGAGKHNKPFLLVILIVIVLGIVFYLWNQPAEATAVTLEAPSAQCTPARAPAGLVAHAA